MDQIDRQDKPKAACQLASAQVCPAPPGNHVCAQGGNRDTEPHFSPSGSFLSHQPSSNARGCPFHTKSMPVFPFSLPKILKEDLNPPGQPNFCFIDKTVVITAGCPTLCGPMDCTLPGSSVHGISQARMLEWVAISFSRGSPPPRDRITSLSLAGRLFNTEHQGKELSKCKLI